MSNPDAQHDTVPVNGSSVNRASNDSFADFQIQTIHVFEQFIEKILSPNAPADPLVQAMQYSVSAGGKRLRPLLCIAAADTFGASVEDALRPAAAVELVHTYSLIHDDLPCMDNDEIRRGRPTNHVVYGEAMALLAGDGLLTHAFSVLAESNSAPDRVVKMVASLARAAGPYGMVAGQAADMTTGSRSSDRLRFIHTNKTARLIQAALDLGALIGNATDEERNILAQFGDHIGHAFQMMDDWLDVCGTTEELGKQVGHDQKLDKLTYPAIFGVDQTLILAEREFSQAIGTLQSIPRDTWRLQNLAEIMVRRRK